MKRFFAIVGLGLLLGLGGYSASYFLGTAQVRALASETTPELAWLKHEFNLSDAEFKRISDLHNDYQTHCAEMCRRIDEKNDELKAALKGSAHVTTEAEQKLAEAAALRAECQRDMLKHFFAVSQTMPPEQGRRYLSWVIDQTFPLQHGMPGMQHTHGSHDMEHMDAGK